MECSVVFYCGHEVNMHEACGRVKGCDRVWQAESYSDVKDDSEIVNGTILQFIPFTHMLYNIVHSKSFYMHIELLNKTEGVHLKVFFEYCQMVMMSSCPIAFLVGIFNNILGVGNLWDVKISF